MSSSPSDHTPGSLPSWPLMDFNTSLSCLLQEELLHPPSFIGSKISSPSSSFTPPQLLSSPASMGASSAKISKRKSRAVTKPPIRVLSADRETFRDMVQKLTGIPSSPSMQASRLWGTSNPSAIFRPMAARPAGSQSDLVAAAHQSMPTLDTSSAYLSRALSHNNFVYNEGGKSRFNTNYEANFDPIMRQAVNFDPSGGAGNFESSGGGMFEGGAFNEGGMAMDMESLRRLRRPSEIESFIMGSNKLDDLLQINKMDPWLSSDLSPQVEIAHSA